MATELYMPKAGMDMKEGVINKWLVEVGAQVKEGDPVLEIETDKVSMEVESPADGTLLCQYFPNGAVVPVVTVIAYVGTPGEKVPDAPTMAGGGQLAVPAKAASAATPAAPTAPATPAAPAPVFKPSGYEYDVAVIGGGPAGYVAAIKAAQLGGKVVIFEQDVVGGTCLNRGCIPTKTYLKTAEYIHHIKAAKSRGIVLSSDDVAVDMESVHAYKQKVVKKLTVGVASLLKSRSVKIVKGTAALAGKNTVECDGIRYEAGSILLCGGSKAGIIPIPGADLPCVVTSDGILAMKTLPQKLTVIGGGVIGCEIATAFAAFGSEVTVVELMDRLVPMMDAEVSKAIKAAMEKDGIKLLLGKQVEKIVKKGETAAVHVAGEAAIDADCVLLSIGRSSELSCLGTLANELKMEKGKLIVDDYCRTNIPNIYACGDITTVSTLAHAAFHMGETAATNAMGGSEATNLRNVPSCLYTIPEAASIGMTEEDAKKRGPILVGRFPMAANGRSLASGEAAGFIKVIADKQYGELLGVHIVGGVATEMITEAKVLMDMEITIHEAATIMHAHPTYSEAFMEACCDALDKCIHLPPKKA